VPADHRQRIRRFGVGAFEKPVLDGCCADLPQIIANRNEGVLRSLRVAAQP
jgi:hypothetical protein